MALTKATYSMINGQYINAADYGAVGDGVTNDTAALNAAYAAAATSKLNLYIPPGDFVFTSQLVWDKKVNVFGNRGLSNLRKQGNFDGILITDLAEGCTFDSFRVLGLAGNGGSGIVLRGASYVTIQNLQVSSHAGSGIYVDNTLATGTIGTFKCSFVNLILSANGSSGIALDGTGPGTLGDPTNVCNTCYFENLNCVGNAFGFRQFGNDQAGYHYGVGINCENNTNQGMIIEGIANFFSAYVEANTSAGLNLSSTSTRNIIALLNDDLPSHPFQDNGTNNILIGGGFAGLKVSSISSPPQRQNIAGRDMDISGASSLSTGAAFKGGDLLLFGGNAAGTGNAGGGKIRAQGGTPVGTSSYGPIVLQPSGGGVTVGADVTPPTSVLMRFESTTKAVQYVGISTAQRDALTPVAGMQIFNSSTSKMQIYDGSSWIDLH
jgi:hypothetical protein